MKKFWIAVVVVAIVGGGLFLLKSERAIAPAGDSQKTPDKLQEASDSQPIVPRVEKEYAVYYGENGKTAFDLLKSLTKVGFKKYSFGVFVESVNDVTPDKDHFWKLYVNGKESQVGADQVQTKESDLIEWKLEKISN